jgi:hypothetical protein
VYRVPVNTAPHDEQPEEGQNATAMKPVKNGHLNVGRVLSARNERRIRDAQTNLTDVLAELGETEEE